MRRGRVSCVEPQTGKTAIERNLARMALISRRVSLGTGFWVGKPSGQYITRPAPPTGGEPNKKNPQKRPRCARESPSVFPKHRIPLPFLYGGGKQAQVQKRLPGSKGEVGGGLCNRRHHQDEPRCAGDTYMKSRRLNNFLHAGETGIINMLAVASWNRLGVLWKDSTSSCA